MTKGEHVNNPMTSPASPVKNKKKKKVASLDRKKARVGWLFVLPFVIGLIVIYLPLIYNSISLSFCAETSTSSGTVYEFIGWENYRYVLMENADFKETLAKGLFELVLQIPAIVIFALFMAVLLNQKMAGRAAFRAIFFIPVVISTGIMESINASDMVTGSTQSGVDTGADAANSIVNVMDLERLFSNMKIGSQLATYVVSIVNNIYDIVNKAGVQMLIFLAGLQAISPAIYESCKIDGATGWETFWKITFPMISPMILVNGVYTIIDSFTSQTNSVMAYINEHNSKSAVQSSAMAWIYFLIVILIVGVIAAILSARVFYQRRER